MWTEKFPAGNRSKNQTGGYVLRCIASFLVYKQFWEMLYEKGNKIYNVYNMQLPVICFLRIHVEIPSKNNAWRCQILSFTSFHHIMHKLIKAIGG
jgi:hypothetical protein